MCDVQSGEEITLDLPGVLFKKKIGFSMDFGGSGLKLVYTTLEGDNVCFHFIIYPRERKDEAFEVIRQRIQGRVDPEATMYLTGYGCAENLQEIQENIHQNVELVWELAHLIKGLQFLLDHVDIDELFFPASEKAIALAAQRSVITRKVLQMAGSKQPQAAPVDGDNQCAQLFDRKNIYPFMLLMTGSAGGAVVLNEDGSYVVKASTGFCGRSLLGLGSIATGAKSFEELMALAERGDRSNIDVRASDLKIQPNNIYENIFKLAQDQQGRAIFHFGKTAEKSKDECESADLAAGLVGIMAHTLALYHHQAALLSDSRRVLVTGSLTSHSQLFREELETEFRLAAEKFDHGKIKPDIRFIKLGGFLGTLGALVKSLQS